MKVDKILFPTDFSRCAEQAFEHALELAMVLDAELILLHAVVLRGEGPIDPMYHFPVPEEIYERVSTAAREQLTGLHVERRSPVRLREAVERGFHAGRVILEFAATEDVDLIVMGTHGRRGPSRVLLGSVAEEVVRHAKCPVMTLRERDHPWPLSLVKILVPVDLADEANPALPLAWELGKLFDASLEILHVVPPMPWGDVHGYHIAREILEEQDARVTRSRQQLLSRLEHLPGDVDLEVRATVGQPAPAILEYASQIGADLVVMAARGLKGLERLMLGSTTEKVLRLSGCPVLTIPAEAKLLTDRPTWSTLRHDAEAR